MTRVNVEVPLGVGELESVKRPLDVDLDVVEPAEVEEGVQLRGQLLQGGAVDEQVSVVRPVKHPGGPKRSVSTSHVQSLDDSLHRGQEQIVRTDCGSGNPWFVE